MRTLFFLLPFLSTFFLANKGLAFSDFFSSQPSEPVEYRLAALHGAELQLRREIPVDRKDYIYEKLFFNELGCVTESKKLFTIANKRKECSDQPTETHCRFMFLQRGEEGGLAKAGFSSKIHSTYGLVRYSNVFKKYVSSFSMQMELVQTPMRMVSIVCIRETGSTKKFNASELRRLLSPVFTINE